MERHQSIDAQLRLLVSGKVSKDDKLVEYDALLVDRFLDILQDLHVPHLREFVRSRRLIHTQLYLLLLQSLLHVHGSFT